MRLAPHFAKYRAQGGQPARHGAGFTLIELMVAMVLGLIVIAGVASVFVANMRSYRANTALSDVQSNARITFELMARDIRQAGLAGCNALTPSITNVLNGGPGQVGGSAPWWTRWGQPVTGFDATATDSAVTAGTQPADRVTGTDSLQIMGTTGAGATIDPANPIGNGGSATSFGILAAVPNLSAGNLVMVCSPLDATIFQVTSYTGSTVGHETSGGMSPGNYSANLGDSYGGANNAMLFRLTAHDWYIGHNPVGGRSLYRLALQGDGSVKSEEMVRNVTGMQVRYHSALGDEYVAASAVPDWSKVDAVRTKFTMQSSNQRAGTDAKPIQRSFTATTTLRNRVN